MLPDLKIEGSGEGLSVLFHLGIEGSRGALSAPSSSALAPRRFARQVRPTPTMTGLRGRGGSCWEIEDQIHRILIEQ